MESFKPGDIFWVELITPNLDLAADFYAKLFNWTYQDMPIEGDHPYRVVHLDGKPIGGMIHLSDSMEKMGVPPCWGLYVNVENCQTSVDKVKQEGGSVEKGPIDLQGGGYFAVISDPTGATFNIMQSKNNWEPVHRDVEGMACWFELKTNDIDQAGSFYGKMFDWELEASHIPGYIFCKNKGVPIAGMMEIQEQWGDMPPNWVIYFSVKNCDKSMERIKSSEGIVIRDKILTPKFGWSVGIQDPTGAMFCFRQEEQT